MKVTSPQHESLLNVESLTFEQMTDDTASLLRQIKIEKAGKRILIARRP